MSASDFRAFLAELATGELEEAMVAARNPYERRTQLDEEGQERPRAGRMTGWLSGLDEPPRPLPWSISMEDLNAMVASARASTAEGVREQLGERHFENLRNGQREAWDDGYRSGRADGLNELLGHLDKEFGGVARELATGLADDAGIVITGGLPAPGASEKQLVALRSSAYRAAGLLRRLLDAHHEGFGVTR